MTNSTSMTIGQIEQIVLVPHQCWARAVTSYCTLVSFLGPE